MNFVKLILLFILCNIIVVGEALGLKPNAKMETYTTYFDFAYHQILVPDDFSKYNYLYHCPLSAFSFLDIGLRIPLEKIPTKQIKSNSFGRYGNYYHKHFKYIKGFEETSKLIETWDEFEIEAQRENITKKLEKCFINYFDEYHKFTEKEYTFVLLQKKNRNYQTKLDMYPEGARVDQVPMGPYCQALTKDDYNFDKKTLRLNMIIVPRESYWQNAYSRIKKLPKKINLPVSIEDAKKLFKDGEKVYCITLITVKTYAKMVSPPTNARLARIGDGSVSVTGSRYQKFDILKITKQFFKESSWSNEKNMFEGEPILSLSIDENSGYRLH